MGGSESVDDTVFVGFENQSKESTLNGEGSGIGRSRGEDLLCEGKEKG